MSEPLTLGESFERWFGSLPPPQCLQFVNALGADSRHFFRSIGVSYTLVRGGAFPAEHEHFVAPEPQPSTDLDDLNRRNARLARAGAPPMTRSIDLGCGSNSPCACPICRTVPHPTSEEFERGIVITSSPINSTTVERYERRPDGHLIAHMRVPQ